VSKAASQSNDGGMGSSSSTKGHGPAGTLDEEVYSVERLSKRLRLSDTQLLQSMIAEADSLSLLPSPRSPKKSGRDLSSPVAAVVTATANRADKVRAAIAANYVQLTPESVNAEALAFGDLSITQMEYLGLEVKSGFLMKQSSILGMCGFEVVICSV
jgi:hypothetical protein